MKYLNTIKPGEQVRETYMAKEVKTAVTKNDKEYWNVTLQDKSGTVNAKVWDPSSPGIEEFSSLDYINIVADSQEYKGQLQLIIRQASKVSPKGINTADYLPCSEYDIDEMYSELMNLVDSVKTWYYHDLLMSFFGDERFKKSFCRSSAAKSVHHNFVGGLLEHTLSVARVCNFFAKHYTFLDRDLLVTAAICHDIGKIYEFSPFPENDYTDQGNLLGHIVIGTMMVRDHMNQIEGFPQSKKDELEHCILAHHGKLDFGSPKRPSICEAMALYYADDVDAKMQTMKQAIYDSPNTKDMWKGYNKFLETNLRATTPEED